MRLLLVDDHPLFLEGMRNLLSGRGVQIVATARDGYEALAAARALQPDTILMDLRMPRCDGLTATALIKSELPSVRVVVLTMSSDDADLYQAIRLGASGYLLKTQDADSFFHSLDEIARGEVALAPGLAQRLMAEFSRMAAEERHPASRPEQESQGQLSPRQAQILTLVGRGLTYKEIGSCLGLAERTVKYHMGEILAALHLKNRGEVAAYARAHCLDRPG
jgi:two-component system NarL family response regulator